MFIIELKRIFIVIIGAFFNALSLNFFLIGANVYASGFTGAAQLISSIFSDFLGIGLSTGILLFLLNIPVLLLSRKRVYDIQYCFGIFLLTFSPGHTDSSAFR